MMEPPLSLSLRQRLLGKSKAKPPSGGSRPVESRNERFRLIPLTPNIDLPLRTLQEGEESASGSRQYGVDIVAVHGLGGDPYKTWTHEDGTLWLRDIAPMQLPGSRVYTFGYDSAFAFSQGTGSVRDFARCLLEALRLERTLHEERPIIFVCHSMGGIVVKQALIIAKNETDHYPMIGNSVCAILFLGTPHQGSPTANYGKILGQIVNTFVVGSGISRYSGSIRADLLSSLRTSEDGLLRIAEDFRIHTTGIKVFSFIEQKSIRGLNQRIVDDHSGFVGSATERKIPLPGLDHREMCRYNNATDPGLQLIMAAIRESACYRDEMIIMSKLEYMPPRSRSPCQIPRKRIVQIPFQQNRSFVGRKEVLKILDSVFHSNNGDRQVALYGLGGIGKSQIALQYTHTKAQELPGLSIFWVFAGTRDRFERDYVEIAQQLDLKGREEPEVDIMLLVKNALERDDLGNWIMVIDNADDMGLFFGCLNDTDDVLHNSDEGHGLSHYIPECATGRIIYTTRSKVDALRLTSEGEIIPVTKMDMEDSKVLLRSKLANEILDEHGWEEILEELDYLPLAIVQAASFIRQNSWTVSQYLKHFHDTDRRDSAAALRVLMHEFRDKHRDRNVSNAVLKTWIITVEQLEAQYPLSAQILWRMAFVHRQNIPRCLLDYDLPQENMMDTLEPTLHEQTLQDSAGTVVEKHRPMGIDQLDFETAIGKLKAYSFISATEISASTEENYTIHRLVQLFVRYWLYKHKGIGDQIASNTLARLCLIFPKKAKPQEWTLCADLLSHIQPIVDSQPSTLSGNTSLVELLYEVSHYLRDTGQYSAAETTITNAICLLSESESTKSLLLKCRFRLASTLCQMGRLQEAEVIQRQSVAETEDMYGPDDRYTLDRKSFLGHLLELQGKYEEAEILIMESSQKYETLYAIDDDTALSIKRDLARVLLRLDKLEEAEQTIRAILETRQGMTGSQEENIIPLLSDLADILFKQKMFPEAETLRRGILERDQRVLGPDHPFTLTSMSNLASSLVQSGRFAEGDQLFRRLLALQEKILADNHEETLATLEILAICSRHQNRFGEAADFMQRALDGYKERFGPDDARAVKCSLDLDELLEQATHQRCGTSG